MSGKFSDWLASELQKRSWSYNELSRQSGLSRAMVSSVMTGAKKPGFKFCLKVAWALDVPPVQVLQLAGHLPADEEGFSLQDPPAVVEIVRIVRNLSPEKQRAILNYLRYHFGAEPDDVALREATDLLNELPPEKRREALNYLRYLRHSEPPSEI